MSIIGDFSRASTETDLELSVVLSASAAAVWKAWATASLLQRWWAPKPWETPVCEIDLRPGGLFRTVMRGPDGNTFDCGGAFIVAEPERRIVFTDALTADLRPAAEPFFTAVVTIGPTAGGPTAGGTRYTARTLHKNAENRQKHEDMGFFDGWTACIRQLAEVAAELDHA